MVKSLNTFVESKRDCFQEYEKEGIEKSGTTEYIQKRERQRNVGLHPLDQPRHVVPRMELTQSDKFRIQNFLPVNLLISLLVLCNIGLVLTSLSRLGSVSYANCMYFHHQNYWQQHRISLRSIKTTLMHALEMRLCSLLTLWKHSRTKSSRRLPRAYFMYQLILEKQVQGSYPNAEIALRMYLVTGADGQ